MTDAGAAPLGLSVVVPLFNEEESVGPLIDAVTAALAAHPSWELVLVDDGSSDHTVERARARAAADPRIRVIRLARNYGQTPAMQAGFDHARGRIVVSMDGDLQNDPDDILRLVAKLEEGYDLVAGWREKRQDKVITRKIPSWFANRIIRRMTGVNIRDNGCSLKAYRREVLDRVRLYSDMHRFIPAVAAALAGARITEVPVRHHARRFGASKYGLSRVLKVLGDLLTIKTIRSFRERPLMLFGGFASASLTLGVINAVAAVYAANRFRPEKAVAIVLPGTTLLWFSLAFFLVLAGLVAEAVLRQHQEEGADPTPLLYRATRDA